MKIIIKAKDINKYIKYQWLPQWILKLLDIIK